MPNLRYLRTGKKRIKLFNIIIRTEHQWNTNIPGDFLTVNIWTFFLNQVILGTQKNYAKLLKDKRLKYE